MIGLCCISIIFFKIFYQQTWTTIFLYHFRQLFDRVQVSPNHSKARRKVGFVWCFKSSHDDKLKVEFERNQSMAKFALFDLEGWIRDFNRLRKIAHRCLNYLNLTNIHPRRKMNQIMCWWKSHINIQIGRRTCRYNI